MSPDPRSFHDASAVIPEGFWNFERVEERLIEAMEVVMRSPDRERRWLRPAASSLWRLVQPEPGMGDDDDQPLVTVGMTRDQQARANEALAWVSASVAEGETRHILGLALMQLARGDAARISWTKLWKRLGGQRSGWTTEGLRKRYGRAITDICHALNR